MGKTLLPRRSGPKEKKTTMRAILTLAVALALTSQVASADDPYSDVNAMRNAFAQVHTATATERFADGSVATVEFNAPDRYKITTPVSQIVLSGDTEYAKTNGGQWAISDKGAEHQALLQEVWQLAGPTSIDLHKLYAIRSLGSKTVGGIALRGYSLKDVDGAYTESIWIDRNNLPVAASIQLDGQTIDIHYSNYNASTLIATPL